MKNNSEIKAVVFDVGGILLPLDFKNFHKGIGLDPSQAEAFNREAVKWEVFHDYERGDISTFDFLEKLKERFHLKEEHSRLVEIWNSFVLDVFPEMEHLLRALRRKVSVYCLSNINELHLDHIFKRNNIFAKVDEFFASHLMGTRKPENKIYETLIRELKILPSEILFFDDNRPNVDAAKALGIQSFWIRDPLHEIPEVMAQFF